MDPRLKALLESLGLRLDAKYTATLEQALEHVRAQTYDIKYPELRARRFIPVDMSVDPGAETVAYQQWDEIGMASIIANYAEDLPMVTALAEKFANPVVGLGQAYDYSIQDLRRAAMSGNDLNARKARIARKGIERRIDEIASVGDAKSKLKGMLNHPNVTILAATSDGTSARWVGGRSPAKAPVDIKQDMFAAISSVWVNTKQSFSPDTILLPTTEYGHVSQTSVGTENQETILSSFLKNNPYVSNVDFWHKLDTADAAGTGPRMVTYQRDPEVLELVIPQDFEQLPPQTKSLSFVVPCHARVGGVVVRYPLAIVYTDGI